MTTDAAATRSTTGPRPDRLAAAGAVIVMVILALGVGGYRLVGGGARLASSSGAFSTPVAVGTSASVTLPLDATDGVVTLESVRMAKPVPGLELTFQVAEGPCPAGVGLTDLPADCRLRPAEGASIRPGATRWLVVTYTVSRPVPVAANDIVIDYRDGWHHRTTHNHELMCFNGAVDERGLCR